MFGIWTNLTPRKKVAATNPAKSPITPPPKAMIKSVLVNLKSNKALYNYGKISKRLDCSP